MRCFFKLRWTTLARRFELAGKRRLAFTREPSPRTNARRHGGTVARTRLNSGAKLCWNVSYPQNLLVDAGCS